MEFLYTFHPVSQRKVHKYKGRTWHLTRVHCQNCEINTGTYELNNKLYSCLLSLPTHILFHFPAQILDNRRRCLLMCWSSSTVCCSFQSFLAFHSLESFEEHQSGILQRVSHCCLSGIFSCLDLGNGFLRGYHRGVSPFSLYHTR